MPVVQRSNGRIDIGQRTLLAKTCTKCGVLKSANKFNRHTREKAKGLFYNSWCNPCIASRTYAGTKAKNEKSIETATSHRNLWTGEDFKLLEQMVSEHRTVKYMAEKLGRTVNAVYNMRKRST